MCKGVVSRGFTLIELLVGATVLALLATLAVPSFDAYLQRRQVEGLSSQFLADWQFLRSTAVARNVQFRLSIFSPASGAGGCYVLHSGAADACRCESQAAHCNAGTDVLRVVALPVESRLRLRANVASLLVDPRHGTVSPAGSIEITAAQGDSLKHVVNLLGRVRVCAASGHWIGVNPC